MESGVEIFVERHMAGQRKEHNSGAGSRIINLAVDFILPEMRGASDNSGPV